MRVILLLALFFLPASAFARNLLFIVDGRGSFVSFQRHPDGTLSLGEDPSLVFQREVIETFGGESFAGVSILSLREADFKGRAPQSLTEKLARVVSQAPEAHWVVTWYGHTLEHGSLEFGLEQMRAAFRSAGLDSSRVDLLLLATCENGRQEDVKILRGITRVILGASTKLPSLGFDLTALKELRQSADAVELGAEIARRSVLSYSSYLRIPIELNLWIDDPTLPDPEEAARFTGGSAASPVPVPGLR